MSKKVKDRVDKKKKKKDKKSKPKKPLSLFGLFVSIIKGIIKSIPKMWKSILIRSVISFLVVTGFSFYTIAMKNEGVGAVRYASGTFWGDVINTGGNEAAFNTMCFVATYALTLIFSRIRTGGIKKFFKDIFGTLPWTKKCITGSRKFVGQVMFFTLALIMFLGIFTKNNLLFITLSITLFFEYASQDKGLISVVALASWNDFHRVFKRKKGIQPLNMQYVGVINLSMLLGMIILALIPVNRAKYFSIILMILFVTLAILLTYNKISKKAVKNTMLFITFAFITQKLTGVVFADNGGWSEGGRSVTTYVGSAGSVGVFITSAVSGIFSVAGGLLGIVIGGITGSTDLAGNWNYGSEMGSALGEDIAYVGIETAVGIKDLTVDVFTGGHLIKETFVNSALEVGELMDSTIKISKDAAGWIQENITPEVALDTVEGMVKDINGIMSGEYAADWIKDELQAFSDDPEKYVNDAIAVIEHGGKLTVEASVAVKQFLNKIKNDPRAAYEIIKAISPTDSIKNMIDPNKHLAERLLNVGFATMDVADIFLGFGLVNIATETANQGVKLGVRTAIRETAEGVGKKAIKETAEGVGIKAIKETAEDAGIKVIKETAEDAGGKVIKETAEGAGGKVIKETTEGAGEKAIKETTEGAGEKATKETVEGAGSKATKETTQQSVQETAEQRVENEIKNIDELPPGKKDELINAQREYDEALQNAKNNTERMIDDLNDGKGISKEDVIKSRGSIDTRAVQGEKIGDAGRASDIPDNFVEEYNKTLKDVQRTSYDDMIGDLRKDPKYKDAQLRIKEVRTNDSPDAIYRPGDKSASNNTIPDSINADNDFTVQRYNERTKRWEEIRHKDFEDLYYQRYAEHSGYTPERAKELYPDQKWDGITPEEKLKQIKEWGERQGEMPTSVSHVEGIREFSREGTAQLGGKAPSVEINGVNKILSPKDQAVDGLGELIDPTQLKMAEQYKFAQPWKTGTVHSQSEALEQLDKAGDLLGKLENGYRDMGGVVPDMPQNMKDGLKVISERNLAPALREAKIKQLGFRSMEDFASLLTSRFEFLKFH